MVARIAVAIVAVLFAAVGPVRAAEPDDKTKMKAKEVVEQFIKAIKAEDLDALLKIIDVPWLHDNKVIKDKDDQKATIKKAFDDKDFSNLSAEIREYHTYGDVREKLKEDRREKVDEVLSKEDVIVMIQLDTGDGNKRRNGVLVKIKDGKAKVVGLAD